LNDGRQTRLTDEATSVRYYDIAASGRHLVATFDPPPVAPPSQLPECQQKGCRVTSDNLYAAEHGIDLEAPPLVYFDLERGTKTTIAPTQATDPAITDCRDGYGGGISPDGAHILRLCNIRRTDVPQWWQGYLRVPRLHAEYLRQWVLIDLKRNETRRLTEAPTWLEMGLPVWIDGGKRLILPAAFESLVDVDAKERERRAVSYAALLFDLETGKSQRIARLDPRTARVLGATWNDGSQTLTIDSLDANRQPLQRQTFRRTSNRWVVANASPQGATACASHPDLIVQQSLNDRPVLMAVDPASGVRRQVLDPNPWLVERQLARAEMIEWKLKSGTSWKGALYYPIGYTPGKRYPLLIQTHGVNPNQFTLTGYTLNFVAQPLAAHDVMVLQADEETAGLEGVAEYTAVLDGYESAVDHLSALGLVDRDKVGLIGWSASGPFIGFTLTHSEYPFAAAAFTDTADFGWWWYLSIGARNGERIYGGPPFGANFDVWRRNSPSFNLDRVKAPMLMWSRVTPAGLWDWYVGLRRLDKPVEYWVLPDGQHEAFKIGERLRTNQLLVDWFRFWLKGEEDADPIKAEQYERWRKLRRQRDQAANTSMRAGTVRPLD
jgi:dipeptidyl aminopeptidase/acylaminoacyl peptidase